MTSIDRAVSKLGGCVNELCKTQQNIKTTIGLGSSCCNKPICVQISGPYPYVFDTDLTGPAAFISVQVANSLDIDSAAVDIQGVIVDGSGCTNRYFYVSDDLYNRISIQGGGNQLSASLDYEFVLTDSSGNVITGSATGGNTMFFKVLSECTLSGPFSFIIP